MVEKGFDSIGKLTTAMIKVKRKVAEGAHLALSYEVRENLVSGFTTTIDLSERWLVHSITTPLDLSRLR